MALFRDYWTFPVPGTDCLVAVAPDREGLLLLNATAAWIWLHSDTPKLVEQYSERFGISLPQAKSDIQQTFDSWHRLSGETIPLKSSEVRVHDLPRSITYVLNHVVFEVRFANAAVEEELSPRLADLRRADHLPPDHIFDVCEQDDKFAVYSNGVLISIEPLVTSARAAVLQEMVRLAVPGRDFRAILHAGAIGDENGCLILAGASFSGKSTLCAAAMMSGWICYAEDSAALTPDLQLAGMPFALSLREGSWPLFPHLDRPRFLPSNLNGTTPTVPVKALVFVSYEAAAEATLLERIDAFDALLIIKDSGFWVEHSKAATAAFIEWLGKIPIYRLTYSALPEGVAAVKSLL